MIPLISSLSATEARVLLPQLHELLHDAVDSGAAVGFLPLLAAAEVQDYPNNDHRIGTFGGISTGTFTVANAAGYRLQDVIVMVNYYTPSGGLINTNSVSVSKVPAKGQTTEVFPSSGRGVRVDCHVIGFSVPGLDYKYNIYVDETDIGNPK